MLATGQYVPDFLKLLASISLCVYAVCVCSVLAMPLGQHVNNRSSDSFIAPMDVVIML